MEKSHNLLVSEHSVIKSNIINRPLEEEISTPLAEADGRLPIRRCYHRAVIEERVVINFLAIFVQLNQSICRGKPSVFKCRNVVGPLANGSGRTICATSRAVIAASGGTTVEGIDTNPVRSPGRRAGSANTVSRFGFPAILIIYSESIFILRSCVRIT